MTELEAAARSYATKGWRVLPLSGKIPLLTEWPTLATTDYETIGTWWTQYRNANVGIATGKESGLLILDVDIAKGGDETLQTLEAQYGGLPRTIEVITGGGGQHYYFEHPGCDIRNSAGKLGPGLDIRADGGQVVAPPSIHPDSGRTYEWEAAHHPDDVPLAEVPPWLLQKLTATSGRGSGPFTAPEHIPDGQRNDTLYKLGRSLKAKGLSLDAVAAAVRAENAAKCAPPLSDAELEDLIDHAGRQPDRSTFAAATPETVEDTPLHTVRLTDVGNSERFAHHHRDAVRYCYPIKAWFVCNDSSLWVCDPGHRAIQLAKDTVRSMYDEIQRETDDERRAKLAAHAVKSENAQRLQAMIDLARSERGIAISPDAFDADPWLFSVINGVLDLRTGMFRERQRGDLISKQSPVVFDASASCPNWLRFLTRIFRNDQHIIGYMRQIAGYCLTGLNIEQVFFLLWGSGANGKSTLLKVLLKLFGDYGLQVPADTFLSRTQDGRATPDLARLQGTRLAVAIESDEGCRLAEGTLKQMTGGDRIAARRLYQDFIEFEPTHKILFSTNHKPRVRDNTHAMWRRMRLIPFEVQIADREQDPRLADKLLTELPGILNWALAGCLAWQQAGQLQTPGAVVAATASYRTEQDVLDDFLRERCVCGEDAIVEFAALRKHYADWAADVSERLLSSKSFAAALQERGFRPTLIRNARHYEGVRIRTIDDEFLDAQTVPDEAPSSMPMQTEFIVEATDVGDR